MFEFWVEQKKTVFSLSLRLTRPYWNAFDKLLARLFCGSLLPFVFTLRFLYYNQLPACNYGCQQKQNHKLRFLQKFCVLILSFIHIFKSTPSSSLSMLMVGKQFLERVVSIIQEFFKSYHLHWIDVIFFEYFCFQ